MHKKYFVDRFSNFFNGISATGLAYRDKFDSLDELVEYHFDKHSNSQHICRSTLTLALELLQGQAATIVETGSSAWGTNSSLLFDSYVNSFGGEFYSVDIRLEPMLKLRKKCTRFSKFFCDDSVNFLRNLNKKNKKIDLLYLDSWDLDPYNPVASAIHGLNEFLELLPTLMRGSLILIDDTPFSIDLVREFDPNGASVWIDSLDRYKFFPGKGSLIKNFLENNNIGELVTNKYQLLWKI